jgi:hypothetical protein
MWKVLVFLAPLCPICQDYTHYLNALEAQWEDRGVPVELVGLFPNPRVTEADIARFAETYGVDWELARDTCGWAAALEADWTPECFLLDEAGNVMYSGRVNDLYFALGKHRAEPRVADLEEAVEAVLAGKRPPTSRTTPIGCPIENRIPQAPCATFSP